MYMFIHAILSPECDESSLFEVSSCTRNKTIVVEKGDNTAWSCNVTAPPNSNLTIMLNKEVVPPYSEKDSLMELCDKDPQVLYYVEETPDHVCYSKFTVHIVVCAAGESVVGEYSIVGDQKNITGSRVHVKLKSTTAGLEGTCTFL